MLLLLSRRADTAIWKRSAITGLCTTLTVHLAFDLFPSLWRGFALISLPFVGRLDGTVSMLWIAANLVASLVIVVQLATTRTQLAVASVVGLGAFLVAAPGERVFWSALFVLLLAAWLATCVPNRVVRGQAALHWMQQRVSRRTM